MQGADDEEEYQLQYQEWERTYGSAYRAFHGQVVITCNMHYGKFYTCPCCCCCCWPLATDRCMSCGAQDPQQLQLPSGKDRQSVRKILTSAYSERERVPVPRQASLTGPRQNATAHDPRQRRSLASSAAPSFTARRGSLDPPQYAQRPRTSFAGQMGDAASRSNILEPQGVPLVRRQQRPAYQLRDVDGAYGEGPGLGERRAAPYPASDEQSPVSPAQQALRYEDFLMSGSVRDGVEVRFCRHWPFASSFSRRMPDPPGRAG